MRNLRERTLRAWGASVTKFDRYALAAVLTAAAATLAGCEERAPTRVCVDQAGRRTWDDQCATDTYGVAWRYISAGLARENGVPRVGDAAFGGSITPEAGVTYVGAPAGGISRGGFGGIGEGFGGGHGAGE
jgi:hypothetical protein